MDRACSMSREQKINISLLSEQPRFGNEMEPQLTDPGCDKVLPGQDYRTPVVGAIDEY